MFRKIAFAMLATSVLMGSISASQANAPLPAAPAAQTSEATETGRGWGRGHGHGYGRGYGYHRGYSHGYGRGYGHGYKRFSREHYRWCADRYRSYDARTNTYQPHNGPRRQCWSPYS